MGLSLDSDFQSGNHAMDLQSIVVDSQFVTKLEKAVADGAGYRGKATEEAQNSLRIYNSMLKNFRRIECVLG